MTSSTPKPKKIIVKKLPKFTLDVYAPIAVNDLVVFAVSYLEERGVRASTEEIISICFRLFPKHFAIKNYSHWPDSALVIRRLTDAREKKNIKGNGADGFTITFKGKQIANRVAKALGIFKPVIKKAPVKKKVVSKKPVEKKLVATKPVATKKVITKKPVVTKQSISKPVAAKKVVSKKPVEKKSVITKQPISKPVAAKKVVVKNLVEKKSIATKQPIQKPVEQKKVFAKKSVETKSVITKQPISKPVVTKKVVSKKPVEQKPVVMKQAVQKPVEQKKVIVKKPVENKLVVTKQLIQKNVEQKKVVVKKPVVTKQPVQKNVEEKKKTVTSQPKQLTLAMPAVEVKKKPEVQKQVAVKKEATKPVKINPVVVQVSKEEKVKAGKVMTMVERSDAYRMYQKDGKKSKISEFDFRNMLFATMESSADTLARNVELFKKYANIHSRNDVILFLSFCEEYFSVLLKKKR